MQNFQSLVIQCFSTFFLLAVSLGCSQFHSTHERVNGIYETTTEVSLPDNSVAHTVLIFSRSRERSYPPILLLHELPGLNQKTINYAISLAGNFTVYVPLLFGSRKQDSVLNGMLAYGFNGEWWKRDSLNGSREIIKWLRLVTQNIAEKHHGQKIGIIGMCLTGSLPLALLDNENIHAVVTAQPSLPLWERSEDEANSLDLSRKEWETAVSRAKSEGGPFVYGVRFEKDKRADRKKHQHMKKVFNCGKGKASYIDGEIRYSEYKKSGIQLEAHSTLIREWKSIKGHPTEIRRKDIRRFLANPRDFVAQNPQMIECPQVSQ